MRILLVADIHGNRAALSALAEPHDLCLFLGDLVDYGVEPGACIAWAREHAHHAVRGNHDHGAAQGVPVDGKGGFRYLTARTRPLTRARSWLVSWSSSSIARVAEVKNSAISRRCGWGRLVVPAKWST